MSKSHLLKITRLQARTNDVSQQLTKLTAWQQVSDASVDQAVNEILMTVREQGDKAVLEYTSRFDGLTVNSLNDLTVSTNRIQQALQTIPAAQKQALEFSAERIRSYHQHQEQKDWSFTESDGTVLGQKITALDRIGVYVPGGKAAYPSTVLMTVIPAKVAGVKEIIMTVPAPNGMLNDTVLAAAAIAGVDKIYTIGGAQAIAALAYGTETIARVDKIVGPGNIYVATAKQKVFGQVAIDMVAGPSEICVIADSSANPEWVAMDLLSQAEHDELAQSILISADENFLDQVEQALGKLLPSLEREAIARTSLQNRGVFILVKDLQQAVAICNQIAPEHLELAVDDPEALVKDIRHAGAIFMGHYSSEALGDYVAGPSHVLPTSTTARFSSPLGVYDFQKRSSIIYCSEKGANTLGKQAVVLAGSESLTAHARSAAYRVKVD